MRRPTLLHAGVFLLAIVLPARAPDAPSPDPALPAAALDYRGVTAENFLERIASLDPAPPTDYSLPPVDVAKAFVVDPEGVGGTPSDDNPGSVQRPFATLGRAFKQLAPGAVILLRKGTYRIASPLLLDAANGQTGAAGAPALVASFPGELATLTRAEPVKGWTPTADPAIHVHPLAAPPGKRAALWVNGRLLMSMEQHLRLTSTNASSGTAGFAPLPGERPLTLPGAWAADAGRLLLRAPVDVDPRGAEVAFDTLSAEEPASISIRGGGWIVFHRLAFRRHLQVATATLAREVAFRHCLFQDCLHGLTFFGSGAERRGVVDACLFERVAGPAGGSTIYTTTCAEVRRSLFLDNGPQLAVSAYTSKHDAFSGLRVVGNTFLRAGSCITSTGKGSLIKDNVALASRFLSSAGSDARVEGNFAVYDPGDMARFPHIPRRDIGFRMYGAGTVVRGNTLVGFEQGGAIVSQASSPTAASLVGNRLAGYREFALRAAALDGLTLDANLYAPAAATNRVVWFLKSEAGVREFLTLDDLRGRGAEANGRLGGPPPPLPAILREALEAAPGKL